MQCVVRDTVQLSYSTFISKGPVRQVQYLLRSDELCLHATMKTKLPIEVPVVNCTKMKVF